MAARGSGSRHPRGDPLPAPAPRARDRSPRASRTARGGSPASSGSRRPVVVAACLPHEAQHHRAGVSAGSRAPPTSARRRGCRASPARSQRMPPRSAWPSRRATRSTCRVHAALDSARVESTTPRCAPVGGTPRRVSSATNSSIEFETLPYHFVGTESFELLDLVYPACTHEDPHVLAHLPEQGDDPAGRTRITHMTMAAAPAPRPSLQHPAP